MARLLQYLCDRYFAGEGDKVKEYNIAVDVLGRPDSFDPAGDAIARVEVHRLRKKLREYYKGEGAAHPVQILIPSGSYIPAFVPNDGTVEETPAGPIPELAEEPPTDPVIVHAPVAERTMAAPRDRSIPRGWIVAGCLVLGLSLFAVMLVRSRAVVAVEPSQGLPVSPLASVLPGSPILEAPPGNALRIACGRSKTFAGLSGFNWAADQYFSGGSTFTRPAHHISRTNNPDLFLTGRSGSFSYDIPLTPGVYELRLFFAETEYGPGTEKGGGENSRVFHVATGGQRILSDFDLIADAGAPFQADVRVFKDVAPSPDGKLHLHFVNARGNAILNAIEILPSRTHRLNPIRLTMQDRPVVDAAGKIWAEDNYWDGGLRSSRQGAVEGSRDPMIYGMERYGNFTYSVPVAAGVYDVTLHFLETYWGAENPGGGGVGTRIFDVFCNGVALLRSVDIYSKVGGNHPYIQSFRGLQANAQGKLILSFVPVRNYASVYAIEVLDASE